jgi:hypothetical protein
VFEDVVRKLPETASIFFFFIIDASLRSAKIRATDDSSLRSECGCHGLTQIYFLIQNE